MDIEIHFPPKNEKCPDGSEHQWKESEWQKSIGAIGKKHQDQECQCGAVRCVWIYNIGM